jgi:hypothetical protein
MSDAATEAITLQAFPPGELLTDANVRTDAEATVTKTDVALCNTIAASRPDGCGNNVPVTLVRRPDGKLPAAHRRRQPHPRAARSYQSVVPPGWVITNPRTGELGWARAAVRGDADSGSPPGRSTTTQP